MGSFDPSNVDDIAIPIQFIIMARAVELEEKEIEREVWVITK